MLPLMLRTHSYYLNVICPSASQYFYGCVTLHYILHSHNIKANNSVNVKGITTFNPLVTHLGHQCH